MTVVARSFEGGFGDERRLRGALTTISVYISRHQDTSWAFRHFFGVGGQKCLDTVQKCRFRDDVESEETTNDLAIPSEATEAGEHVRLGSAHDIPGEDGI